MSKNVVELKREALDLLEKSKDYMGTTEASRAESIQRAQVLALLAVADAINRLELRGE